MNFGDQLSKKKSFALLDQAVKEHAINFIVSAIIIYNLNTDSH